MANTFGITTADISGQVHNLSIRTDTSPSISGVEDMIAYYAAEIARESDAVGIDVDGVGAGEDSYVYYKQAIIAGVIGELLVARNRGDEKAGAFYTKKYREFITTLRKRKQVAIDDTEGPNLAQGINSSLNTNKRTFGSSLAGKLVTGGL